MRQPPAEVRRLVYLGTPAIAVPPLYALHEAGFEIALVVTNKDTRRGRGKELMPTPVKKAAMKLGIPVSDSVDSVLEAHAVEAIDLGVVVAFGHLIRPPVLAEVPMVNIHFSKLPRWRGAAPLERAILAGDDVTAVALMALEESLDTGGVYREVDVAIESTTTLDELRETMVAAASTMLVEGLREGLGEPRPQTGDITWAAKLGSDDRRIDWSGSAEQIHRIIRLGGAHTTLRGKRLRIIDAHPEPAVANDEGGEPTALEPGHINTTLVGTGEGMLRLVTVQPEGKAATEAASWVNGARLTDQDVFGA